MLLPTALVILVWGYLIDGLAVSGDIAIARLCHAYYGRPVNTQTRLIHLLMNTCRLCIKDVVFSSYWFF